MIDKHELLLASLDKQYMLSRGRMSAVVANLCGLQAQFANNPSHALRFRAGDYSPAAWERGLVKTWTFRQTIHVIPKRELALFLAARDMPRDWDDGWGVPRALKPELSESILKWIRQGDGGREALKARCREAGIRDEILQNVFHGWGGLLKEMCQRGLVAYAPGTEKRFVVCKGAAPMDRDAARAKLLKRYFRFLGPATLADCASFMGLSIRAIRAILAEHPLPLKSVNCGGSDYWYLGGWDSAREIPPCLFLAGFDQLLMAYRDRSRLLDAEHTRAVITNTGIVNPTVLVDGRLKAKWKKDGKRLLITPFADLDGKRRRRIADLGMRLFAGEIEAVAFSR